MLQQGEARDQNPWDVAQAWMHQRWGWPVRPMMATPAKQGALAEHQLIAMGAVHELMGERWRSGLSPYLLNGAVDQIDSGSDAEMERLERSPEFAIDAAQAEHIAKFAVDWPPTDEEQATFARLLSGVRLSGDPEVITPEPRRERKGSGSAKAK